MIRNGGNYVWKSGYSGLFVYRFLESGKSTCFQEILEKILEDGLRTLYLMTEEEKKVDEMLLRHNKVDTVLIEDEEDLTEDSVRNL